MDYDSGPYYVMFFAGMTSVPFSISINNDTKFEGNETITLSINSQIPYGIIIGDPDEALLTVVDDDSKYNHLYCKYRFVSIWYTKQPI